MEVSAAAKWSSLECSREDDNNYLVENEAQMTAAGSFSTEVPDASMSFDDKIVEEEICEDEECSDQGDRTEGLDAFEGRMVGMDVMEADVRNALVGRGGSWWGPWCRARRRGRSGR